MIPEAVYLHEFSRGSFVSSKYIIIKECVLSLKSECCLRQDPQNRNVRTSWVLNGLGNIAKLPANIIH